MSGICDKTSNNKYFNCPARMDDGRTFTDYRPNCYVNNLIRMKNNVRGSYEYRQFLIHNAENLMEVNNIYNSEKNGCHPCNAKPVPFKRKCEVDIYVSKCSLQDPKGIGTEYQAANM